MKVLIIGSGGREHAIAQKIKTSPLISKLYAAPGNPGIANIAQCLPIQTSDHKALTHFAQNEKIDLTIIGPETPLVHGLADDLEDAGLAAFGASKKAAQLEGSKDFARNFAQRHNIPQPQFKTFKDLNKAQTYLEQTYPDGSVVIKADGLAAGKGVVVAKTMPQAQAALVQIFQDKNSKTPKKTVIEQRLHGTEASLFAISDGQNATLLGSAQDYKRASDGDTGPNTGGMGAVSPAPALTQKLCNDAWQKIVQPTINGMAQEGTPYKGILYVGLMLTETGPKLIEFNCRLGDPEAQALLPRLKSDLLPTMLSATKGRLQQTDLNFDQRTAVTIVMTNKGYPQTYQTGGLIKGLDDTPKNNTQTDPNTMIFHNGTTQTESGLIASGGRVLSITALGTTQAHARQTAYNLIASITWPEAFFRKDIAL